MQTLKGENKVIYLYVGFGGMVGSVLRYFLAVVLSGMTQNGFPYGTLVANLVGCFALGWLTNGIVTKRFDISQKLITAIGTGMIGSFTTFSTFSTETVLMIEKEMWLAVFLYLSISLLGGLVFAAFGISLGKRKHGEDA